MCSLHLTHPSAHTPGAVGSRHCGARGANKTFTGLNGKVREAIL